MADEYQTKIRRVSAMQHDGSEDSCHEIATWIKTHGQAASVKHGTLFIGASRTPVPALTWVAFLPQNANFVVWGDSDFRKSYEKGDDVENDKHQIGITEAPKVGPTGGSGQAKAGIIYNEEQRRRRALELALQSFSSFSESNPYSNSYESILIARAEAFYNFIKSGIV